MDDDLFGAHFDPRGGLPSPPPTMMQQNSGVGPEEWMCAACTFLNPLTLERCKMCDTPMPVMEVKPAVPFLPSFAPSFPVVTNGAPTAAHQQHGYPHQPPSVEGVETFPSSSTTYSSPTPSSSSSPTKEQHVGSQASLGAEEHAPSPLTLDKLSGSSSSGSLRRRRTGSSKKSADDKGGKGNFGLSVQETATASGGSQPTSPQTPANSTRSTGDSPAVEASAKKKGRAATLFSLGRSKKKDTESSPEKEDHASKSKTLDPTEKDDEKGEHAPASTGSGTPEREESSRRRTNSLVGWVTRKGRRGTGDLARGDTKEGLGEDDSQGENKDSSRDVMKESGELSEIEEDVGAAAAVGADWRAFMSTKRSVLVIVDNLTDETMMRRGAGKLNNGEWGRYPPAVIPAHTAVEFGSYGTNLKGTKGRCIYTVDGYESTFIFEWSNSKVGSPEIRCAQNPKEFKVEVRGRTDKSAEVTFSVFPAAGPKPKRSDAPSVGGTPPPVSSENATASGYVATTHELTTSGSVRSGPSFDNLLDDAEVRAVETFVSQAVASLTPREQHPRDGSAGLESGAAPSTQSFLPSALRESSVSTPSTASGSSASGSVQATSTASNPFLSSNPFSDSSASANDASPGWATGDDASVDWGDEEEQIHSPASKFKFTIKSREEIKPENDTIPAVFKLSSPPPAASNSKQSRRRGGTPGQERRELVSATGSRKPTAATGRSSPGGLAYRHTGPVEHSAESPTPAARLVQRRTGPVEKKSSATQENCTTDASAESQVEDEGKKNVIFEVGSSDAPAPVRPRAESTPRTSPTATPTTSPPGSNNLSAVPLSIATPTPAANVNAIIRQASNLMLVCGTHMQSGRFHEAFAEAQKALALLRSVPDINAVLKPLKICVDYKVAILILTEMDALNKHVSQSPEEATLIKQKIAHLSYQLVPLRLTPQHAAISVRMAISRNMDALNFGAASSLLQLVLSRNPPDAASLNEKLHLCKQMNETNAVSTINDHLCFQTLQRVAQGEQLAVCPLCGSHFAPATVSAGHKCPLCLSADVVIR